MGRLMDRHRDLAGGLLLWAIPWWRGLRTVRVLLAVAATVVLVLLPVRMFNWSSLT
ncbi:hypothetical protein [Micromonospora ureilytica]|uniref:hypothetical protein n=1 Tax=Micromonospora ureilytica TaxID=709868 RepID=UPI00142DD6A5|nr:hypothetical protein [Micromonospora ureilytica]